MWIKQTIVLLWAVGFCQSQCPARCSCGQRDPIVVECRQTGLRQMPSTSELPPRTSTLVLIGNEIPVIQTDVLRGMSSLKKVKIFDSGVTTIEPYAFRGLSRLSELQLQGNAIRILGTHSMAELKGRLDVHLENNSIEVIQSYAFDGSYINRLYLSSGNRITTIQKYAFANLRVRYLDLELPHLKSLEPLSFYQMNNVERLNLNNLDIDVLPTNAFHSIHGINKFFISDGKIGIIQPRTFENASIVTNFKITNMTIGTLSTDSFYNISQVSLFIISDCHMDTVQDYAFRGPQDIRISQIKGNTIGIMEESSIVGVPHISSFHSNYLRCDCSLKPLYEEAMAEVNLPIIEKSYCSSPPSLQNKSVSAVIDGGQIRQCASAETSSGQKSFVLGLFLITFVYHLSLIHI